MKTAGIILAAGWSKRFGETDKLLAAFRGQALVTHAAGAMRNLDLDVRLAVTRSVEVSNLLPDFELVSPLGDEDDQSGSLRAGIKAARQCGAGRALVVLGDMPLVRADLMRLVLAKCDDEHASATTDGVRRMPPACFPEAFFETLLSVEGDKGARFVLQNLASDRLVRTEALTLYDVDRPSDLTKLD